ncbi:MaoC family dehydratase [Acinetobacter bereziniae]|uniref:MaoC family dehydratase n=1 Tax=Acinetobacter bereziniae TaxID=106648 RepID=UPI003212C67A
MNIEKIKLGDRVELLRSFTESDVEKFSQLSGDVNPVHLDENYARNTIFKSRIVHGALASSIFSTIFANTLPGAGCIYLKSDNRFLKPIFLNTSVLFVVEVIEIIIEKRRVIFKTTAISNDKECIVGSAELYIPG